MPAILSKYYLMIAIEAIIFAVFAMSLDLIMGYAGIVSFGHAAFFGLGGYALGMTINVIPSIWIGLIVAAFIAGGIAFFIGVVSIKTRGIYFAILTLLFGELIYRIVFNTPALGGSDGLVGLPIPELHFLFFKLNMSKTSNFYYVIVAFAYICYLVSWKIVESPYGRVLKAIKDNESRIPFIGFNPKYYRITAFVISGVMAGLSGAFFSLFKTFADVSQLHFLLSGKVIIMNLLGGIGTLIGPMVGAIFLTVYETIASTWFESYHLLTGAIFIFVVIFMPRGILGLFIQEKKRSEK
jgi:branched-chain amino acid transport system permease protein